MDWPHRADEEGADEAPLQQPPADQSRGHLFLQQSSSHCDEYSIKFSMNRQCVIYMTIMTTYISN